MASYCPKCNHRIDTQTNFNCPECGEKFWESKKIFENNLKNNPQIEQKIDNLEKEAEEILPKKVNKEFKRHYLIYIFGSALVVFLISYFGTSYAQNIKGMKKNQDLLQQQIDSQKKQLQSDKTEEDKKTIATTTTPATKTTPKTTTPKSTTPATKWTPPAPADYSSYLPEINRRISACDTQLANVEKEKKDLLDLYNSEVAGIGTGLCCFGRSCQTCSSPDTEAQLNDAEKRWQDANSVYNTYWAGFTVIKQDLQILIGQINNKTVPMNIESYPLYGDCDDMS